MSMQAGTDLGYAQRTALWSPGVPGEDGSVGGCCLPVVHVEEELEVELVHHASNLLPVTLHQLRVVHQLLLHLQKTEIRARAARCPCLAH